MSSKIFIAGHRGMVGAAMVRALTEVGYDNLMTRTRQELDLRCFEQVGRFMESERPETVILAAAKVGGIQANIGAPAEFIFDNLMIQNNVIHHASRCGVQHLCFLGSSCVYPRECSQPMKEEYLCTGPVEPTNEGYAIAKIAGIKMAQAYHRQYDLRVTCPMPCNLYGPNDSFDLQHSHVLGALIRRFSDAKEACDECVTLWGTGSARREFLHVDDLARAVLLIMERWNSPEIINVGSGTDVSIRELAGLIAEATGYAGRIEWDSSKPDGMPRKCLDVTRLRKLGFEPAVTLEVGIREMLGEYKCYRQNEQKKEAANDSLDEVRFPRRGGNEEGAGGVHRPGTAA